MALLASLAVAGWAAAAPAAEECENTFPSTYAAIQKVIFENRGCTSVLCHDSTGSGGLDLRADVSYDNLLNKPSQTVEGWQLVVPGQRESSLLFQNVAAKTMPGEVTAPLRPMPLDPLPALTTNELEALRRWIESGAPRDGVVNGTDELLDACLPPAKPIEIEPLPPPVAGTGVQLKMPPWIVDAESEHEVCYATYYDFTDQVPEQFRGPNGTFRYKRTQIRQDPLSHHLIVNLYTGTRTPDDPVWGTFKCRGGAKDGQTCNPTDLGFCGADSGCANDPQQSIACFGQTNLPPDAQTGINNSGFTGAQETALTVVYSPGVYNQIPLKGMIIWNSHAFNVTDTDGKLEAWINFEFAPPEEQLYPLHGIFYADEIFKMNVPAFQAAEVCEVFTMPPNAKLFELSSHMHARGKRWRTFDGMWTCDGGANDGDACSPYGPDEAFATPDLCAGAPCTSKLPPRVGDCDANLSVSINELIQGVNFALNGSVGPGCPRFDPDEDGKVRIADLIAAVAAANGPTHRDAEASLLYTNFVYNDPLILPFDPVKPLGGTHSVEEERSVTFCALYDNGFVDPATVKTRAGSPPTPLGLPLGGPCRVPTGCTAGKIGTACSGANEAQRNASCDTTEGAGDGFCDACPLKGGVTTQDEMFLLLGSFFVDQ